MKINCRSEREQIHTERERKEKKKRPPIFFILRNFIIFVSFYCFSFSSFLFLFSLLQNNLHNPWKKHANKHLLTIVDVRTCSDTRDGLIKPYWMNLNWATFHRQQKSPNVCVKSYPKPRHIATQHIAIVLHTTCTR